MVEKYFASRAVWYLGLVRQAFPSNATARVWLNCPWTLNVTEVHDVNTLSDIEAMTLFMNNVTRSVAAQHAFEYLDAYNLSAQVRHLYSGSTRVQGSEGLMRDRVHVAGNDWQFYRTLADVLLAWMCQG